MGRTTFNWWRRNEKRRKLKTSAPLLQRIQHGDFDTSQYLEEAQAELDTYKGIVEKHQREGKEQNLRHETITQRIFDDGDQYIRRYNRLMKDFIEEEERIFIELRKAFRKHFKVDYNDLFDEWLEGKQKDMTVEELYHYCEQNK